MKNDWIAAYEALKDVYINDAYSNIAINEALAKHNQCSQGFVRTFVKGVIRDTTRLDYYIDKLADKGVRGIRDRVLIILRMGIYAVRSLESVPAHAACNEAVALAKRTAGGSSGFVNAIIRAYVRQADELEPAPLTEKDIVDDHLSNSQVKRAAVIYSMRNDIIRLLNRQYGGEECLRLLEGLNTPPDLILRNNPLKGTRTELVQALSELGIDAEEMPESRNAIRIAGGQVAGTELFAQGRFSIQSLSSILAVEAFAPERGSRVLDMCAAPGGKTSAIAELMANEGSITACDIHPHRCELINASVKRLGIDIVETRVLDASVRESDMLDSYDYVLCDVPCSGLGVMSTKPEIKFKDRADVEELTGLQLEILENAYAYVKRGGYVMYSTCTINRNENEGVIEAFSERHKDAAIIENRSLMPYNNLIGFYYSIIRKN